MFLRIALALLLAAGLAASPLQAQQAAPAKPVAEPQPPLDVDRDPVPSPDDNPDNPTGDPARQAAGKATAASAAEDTQVFTIRKEVSEVLLNVTVLDDKQRLVTSLVQKDFKVLEDNIPQTITVFRHQDLPVSLGIVVDDSGSMQPKRAAVSKAALDLVRLSNPQDETFIVNFAEQPYLDQDFTNDITKLNDGLNHIDSRGGTALYDAVSASADHLAQMAKRGRQVLLIITDGEDNDSSSTLEETVRRVQDLGGPVIYAIGLLFGDTGHNEARNARQTLDRLARETGGAAYFPKSLGEIDDVAAEVARDIRNQYILGYHSTQGFDSPAFRTVKVTVSAKGYGKLSVRTRTGYYPQKEKASARKPAAPK